jgi:hypothetical protein
MTPADMAAGCYPTTAAPSVEPAVSEYIRRSESLVMRLVADEVTGTKIREGLLYLRACVHHKGPVTGDGLVERSRRRQQEALSVDARRGHR